MRVDFKLKRGDNHLFIQFTETGSFSIAEFLKQTKDEKW